MPIPRAVATPRSPRASRLVASSLVASSLVAFTRGEALAAEPRRVELTWIAEPGCPSRDDVASEVERLVRGSPNKDIIVAHAEVAHADAAWRVRLETRSGELVGRREVEAESCAQLADATALILALMIDPTAALREKHEVAPERAPPVAPPSAVVPRAAPPVPAPAPRSPRVVPVAAAQARGDLGTLPVPALGVGVGGGILVDAYRLTLDFGYFPARTGRLVGRPSAYGDFTLFAGALVGCRTMLTVGPARGALCLGAEVDAVLATGFGVSAPASGSAIWGALLAGARIEAPIVSALSAELSASGIVPFTRPPFYFDGIGTVYQPTAVGLRLALGLAVHF